MEREETTGSDDIERADDARDNAVIGADDTGMLAGEQLITNAEIEEGLEGEV